MHNRRQQTAHYGKRNYAHYCERGFCRFVHAERKRYNNLGARQKQRNYSAARYACGATVQQKPRGAQSVSVFSFHLRKTPVLPLILFTRLPAAFAVFRRAFIGRRRLHGLGRGACASYGYCARRVHAFAIRCLLRLRRGFGQRDCRNFVLDLARAFSARFFGRVRADFGRGAVERNSYNRVEHVLTIVFARARIAARRRFCRGAVVRSFDSAACARLRRRARLLIYCLRILFRGLLRGFFCGGFFALCRVAEKERAKTLADA